MPVLKYLKLQNWLSQLILVSFLVASIGVCKAQSGLDTLLTNHRAQDVREKIHIHFDKGLYNPGETIWFKAYLSSGSRRSEYSTTLYTEILNDSGKVLSKKTSPIVFSGSSSHFEIPQNYNRQSLIFRAYTVAMLNSDTNFLFAKALAIVNPITGNPAIEKDYQPSIAFLPEGGDLVAGLKGNVAFRYALPDGKPMNISGTIIGSNGAKMADFKSIHHGMGFFSLLPEPGITYTAYWKDSMGKEKSQALPMPLQEGISLQITDQLDNISGLSTGKKFTVTRSPDDLEPYKKLILAAVMNGELVYEARLNLTARNSVSAVLPTDELESGIMQITIFDANMRPIAERICFINNHNFEFDADTWIAELNLAKRALNVAEVKISDTIAANLSLSITDADMDMPAEMEDNILTHTLFTGDLRGNVYKPYYYLYSTSDSVLHHLDLVMLTHGWRRYNWEKVFLPDSVPPQYVENQYISIDGQLTNSNSNNKSGLELVGFIKTGNSEQSSLVMLPIERNGRFRQDGLFFYDSASLHLAYNDKKRIFDPTDVLISNGLLQANIREGLTQAIIQKPDKANVALMQKNIANNKEYLKVKAKQFANAHELAGVTVTAKAKSNIQKIDERYTSGLFSGGNATQFDVANDPLGSSSLSVFQYLQGRVAGLQITGAGPNATLSWRGGTPGLYLDEMQSDASMIGGISMADVAYIKVFNPGSSFGFRNGAGGVISVYTRRGDDMSANTPSQVGRILLNGYSGVKEFYAVDYSKPSPDDFYDNLATTLYWDPNIWLGDNKKRKTIKFYNNDFTRRFRLVLEGIDANGLLLHVEKVISKD